jgi:DNA-binding transcriptional ArsR family regulator
VQLQDERQDARSRCQTIPYLGRALSTPYTSSIKTENDDGRDLVEALDGNQSNVSRHLQILHQARILDRRRQGKNVRYSLRDSSVFKMIELLIGETGAVGEADLPTRRLGSLRVS